MVLIDRDRVMLDYLKNLGSRDSYTAKFAALSKAVDEAPAVDAAPVKRGEWVMSRKYKPWFTCSACEDCYVDGEWVDGHKWSYCPNCGAKMDLEE